jgi:hypothetical protein
MKKTNKRESLVLAKETLRRLDDRALMVVGGGAAAPPEASYPFACLTDKCERNY